MIRTHSSIGPLMVAFVINRALEGVLELYSLSLVVEECTINCDKIIFARV